MKIGVVIVTYNGANFIRKCLSKLRPFEGDEFNIIVVDNNSGDETIKIIREEFEMVDLIVSDQNLGFGRANNLGILKCIGLGVDQFFLLNQDAWIERDDLLLLSSILKSNESFGVLSPMHLSGREDNLDHYFSQYIRNNSRLISQLIIGGELDDIYEVNFVNAALWLVTKKIILEVGGFDPLFTHYGEDEDWINRLKYHGFKIGISPKVFAIHDRPQHKEKNRSFKGIINGTFRLELIRLKNINTKLINSYFQFVFRMLRYSVGYSMRLDVNFLCYFVVILRMTMQITKIIESRKLSRSNRAFL